MPANDDFVPPKLSPPPATAPLRGTLVVGSALMVAAASLAGCSNGEAPAPDAGLAAPDTSPGEGIDTGPPRDASPPLDTDPGDDAYHADVGTDAAATDT